MENGFKTAINEIVDLLLNTNNKEFVLKGKTEKQYRIDYIQSVLEGQIPVIEYRFAQYLREFVDNGKKYKNFECFLNKRAEKNKNFSVLDIYFLLSDKQKLEIKRKVFNKIIENNISIKEYFKNEYNNDIANDENF